MCFSPAFRETDGASQETGGFALATTSRVADAVTNLSQN